MRRAPDLADVRLTLRREHQEVQRHGIAVEDGKGNPNSTLQDLDIDDNEPSLTQEEKQARVIDLLRARSGVYHPALYESPGMSARKPKRSSHPPRSFWYYNNWDLNALGSIFEKATKSPIFQEFKEQIAGSGPCLAHAAKSGACRVH